MAGARAEQPSTDDMAAAVRTIAQELKARAPEYAASFTERIHERMPEFGMNARVTQQTRDAVSAVIASYARMVLRGGEPTDIDVPAEALEYARAFVHRNIDLQLLSREYRLGHEELWRATGSLIAGQPLETDAKSSLRDVFSVALFGFVDAVTNRVTAEYEAERRRWAQSAESRRRATVDAILAGEKVDPDAAALALRYPLDVTHVALVVSVADPEATASDEQLCGSVSELAAWCGADGSLTLPIGRRVLWGWLGFRNPPTETRLASLVGWRGNGVSLAIGEPDAQLDGFRHSHHEAVAARRVARIARGPSGGVSRWASQAVLGLLSADMQAARRFVTRELGRLDADQDDMARLRATLLAYFGEGDVLMAAAHRLGVHANTVAYRLRRCEDLLGRPVKSRRFELEAALRLRDAMRVSRGLPPPEL